MKKSFLLISISFLGMMFFIVSCKKSQTEPELTLEQIARKDSAFNSSLISKLGAIYMREKYPSNAVNVPLATFTFGKDSLSYMGNTDANGKPAFVSGYIYFNSKDNTKYTFAKSDNGKTLLFGSINANNTPDNFMFSVGAYDDSLIRTVGYMINPLTKTKDVLFELVESKKSEYSLPSPTVKVLGGNGEVDNNMDSLEIKIKKLVIAAIDCLPDWGINKKLAETSAKYGNDLAGLYADVTVKFNNTLNAHIEASEFFESISDKISQLKASAGNTLSGSQSAISNAYNSFQKEIDAYAMKLNYTLTKDKGDQQEVFYGTQPADMVIKTFSGTRPISLAGYCTVTFNNKSQTMRIGTDKNGQGTLRFPVIDSALESGGIRTLKAEFILGGLLNTQKVTFTATVKPKPRLKINLDAATNNQTAEVGLAIPKPLRIRVLDADNQGVANIKINWAESTTGVTVSGLNSTQTVTDGDGYSTNSWTLNGSLGTIHKATATIVASSNNSYLISSASTSFNAQTVKIDSTAQYTAAATGKWTGSWYSTSSSSPSDIDEYELKSDGTGQRTQTTNASGTTTTIPTGDIYNTVTWRVTKSNNSYVMYLTYKNRNISFNGTLENYPNLTYKAFPAIGSTSTYTIMQKK